VEKKGAVPPFPVSPDATPASPSQAYGEAAQSLAPVPEPEHNAPAFGGEFPGSGQHSILTSASMTIGLRASRSRGKFGAGGVDPTAFASAIVQRQRVGTMVPQLAMSRSATGSGDLDPNMFRATTQASRVRQSTLSPSARSSDPAAPAGAAGRFQPLAVPIIARTFSAQEILYLAFRLEPTFSKQNLLDVLERYRLEDFAQGCFRHHRVGSRLQAALSHKFMPIEELTSFSSTPLKKPLLLSVRKELKQHAAYLSELLLEYSRVRPCSSEVSCLRKILHILRENPPELIDDFYFQLIKQTINNNKGDALLKTWELFLVVATIFPCSGDRYMWILAQIARATTDADQRIACVSTFIYIRFQARHYIGRVLDYKALDAHYIEQIPAQLTRGRDVFGCSLYEVMWCQKPTFPKLVVPYVLHYIVEQLKARQCFRSEAIFRVPGNEGLIQAIRSEVNINMAAIARGDVNVIASLLKLWLKDLPNPVVPIELVDEFQQMCEQNKFLSFVERLPQVHQLVLVYLIGFTKELAGNAKYTGMEKADLAMVLGPLIVNPVRSAQNDSAKVQKLTELSVAFFNRLVDVRDTSGIYPLNPAYLVTANAQPPVQGQDEELAEQK
jgi:hypothetical protein